MAGFGAGTVARPKTGKRKPEPSGRNVAFRCSGPYIAWLDGFAKSNRTTVAGVIDRALAELAKAQGYEQPPERNP
jgi:hypothetical protein